MTVKLNGAELNAFMADKCFWTDGRWYDDAAISINGGEFFDWDDEPIAPDDKVRWQGGAVYDNGDVGATFYSLEAEIRKWLKARTLTTIVLEVERNELAGTLLALEKMPGVKVLK